MRHALVRHSGYSTAAFQRANWEIKPAFQWELLRVGGFSFASLDVSKRGLLAVVNLLGACLHMQLSIPFWIALKFIPVVDLLKLRNYCPLLGCMHILFSAPRFLAVWRLFLWLLKTAYGWQWGFELSISIVRLARSLEAEIRLPLCRIAACSPLSRKSCWINVDGFNRDE